MKETPNDRKKLNLDFVAAANPHSWLLCASNLNDQAVFLQRNSGRAIMTQTDGEKRVIGSWDMTNKTVFLLGGLALENMIKAFLVFENPAWISNGRLAGDLRTHDLNELQDLSKIIPLKGQYDEALRELGDGIDSWARYPCSRSIETLRPEAVMRPDLWNAYKILMRTYGFDLMVRLSEKVWRGPHGFKGRWTFQSDFFQF